MSAIDIRPNGWDSPNQNTQHVDPVSPTRRGKVALIIRIIVSIALLIPLPIIALTPSAPRHTPTVSIYDLADLVDDDSLARELRAIEFTQPTNLTILTLPTTNGLDLNTATLEFARTTPTQPPLIDPAKPDYWADGTLILALAPNERLVGTYFGEDNKVPLSAQHNIQDDMKDELRLGRWAPGFVEGARSAAYHTSTDPNDGPAPIIGAGIAGLISLTNIGLIFTRRRTSATNFARARDHYARVSADYDNTMIEAGTIDTSTVYGAQIRQQYTAFTERYHALTRAFQDFATPTFTAHMRSGVAAESKRLRTEAEALDNTDDAIVNTAALLNLTPRWPEVWNNELGPVIEDYIALGELLRETSPHLSAAQQAQFTNEKNTTYAQALQLHDQIARRELTPAQALDALSGAHESLMRISRSILEAVGQNNTHATQPNAIDDIITGNHHEYSGTWHYGGRSGRYNPHSTIRRRVRTSDTRIGGYNAGAGSIAGLVVGYQTSSINPDNHAASSSSGGGYSSGFSGGGGFSGAGSSSSF